MLEHVSWKIQVFLTPFLADCVFAMVILGISQWAPAGCVGPPATAHIRDSGVQVGEWPLSTGSLRGVVWFSWECSPAVGPWCGIRHRCLLTPPPGHFSRLYQQLCRRHSRWLVYCASFLAWMAAFRLCVGAGILFFRAQLFRLDPDYVQHVGGMAGSRTEQRILSGTLKLMG